MKKQLKKKQLKKKQLKEKKPELLVGTGDFASVIAAVKNGADAVYFGIKGFNMRDLGTNFKTGELKKLMVFLHKNNTKGYLALNTIVFDRELKKVENILKKAKQAKIDAVILSDLGVLSLVKKHGLTPFLSTQASAANSAAVAEFKKLGIKRIILARELNLGQIIEIKKKAKGVEIECFVHGAMCISVSGRCFLSHEIFGTSANKGKCLQPCRRAFFLDGKAPNYKKKEVFLQGHTIISPKDLKSIDFLDKLVKAGLDSFKVEGRNKPAHYVATVTACYREAIDAVADKSFSKKKIENWNKELAKVFNRGFSKGFFFGVPGKRDLVKKEGSRQTCKRKLVGKITKFFPRVSVAEAKVFEPFAEGSQIIIEGQTTFLEQTIESMQINHKQIKKAKKGTKVGLKVNEKVRKNDKVFLITQ